MLSFQAQAILLWLVASIYVDNTMDRKHITISESELQKMLQCASEQGAKKILLQLGLSDEEAG